MARTSVLEQKEKSSTLKFPILRFGYNSLLAPKSFRGDPKQTPKFHLDIMIPKEIWAAEDFCKEFRQEVLRVYKAGSGKKEVKLNQIKHPALDGDTKNVEAYQNHILIRPKATTKPSVVDNFRNPMKDEQIALIKPGDYGVCILSVYYFDNMGGGVAAGLEVVQFARPGEPIGGANRTGLISSLEELDDESVGSSLGAEEDDVVTSVENKLAEDEENPF